MRKNMVVGKIVCATQTRSFNIGCDVVILCEPLNKQITSKHRSLRN